MMKAARLGVAGVILSACLISAALKVGDPPGAQMKVFADAFLETLDEEQKKKAVMPYGAEQRTDWHFIPKDERKGLAIRDMNVAQRTASLRLLRAALSDAGYDKSADIMLLEGVIRELEGKDRRWERDPQKYYVTLFGQPSDSDPWGLSWEGHHISLNFSIQDGKVIDSTPQFWGANPGTVMDDVLKEIKKGTRVLRDEEQLAFDLLAALTDQQRKQAMIAEKAPKEVRFAGEAQVSVGEAEGVAAKDLSKENRDLLKQLVHTYTDAVPEKVAAGRRNRIDRNGWDDVYFAWAGAEKPGVGHYYRIRGKEFLIEFINNQPDAAGNPANHIHCVWRDITGDFGLPNESPEAQ